jgi:hypothetical protein
VSGSEIGWEVDLSRLAGLAAAGYLYQVADFGNATGLLGAQFALFNSGSRGLPIRLISARVSASAALGVTLGWLRVDPALGAGNPSSNLSLGGAIASAQNEAAVAAAPAIAGQLSTAQLQAGGIVELISPAGIYIPANTGVVISSAAVAAAVDAIWLWAEIPND